MIVEKEKVATRLREWLDEHPEINHTSLAKRIGLSQASLSNFYKKRTGIKLEKMIALEAFLEGSYGYNRTEVEGMPESFVTYPENKPRKRGDYLVRGFKAGKKETIIAKYNSQSFYGLDGLKVQEWRSIPV